MSFICSKMQSPRGKCVLLPATTLRAPGPTWQRDSKKLVQQSLSPAPRCLRPSKLACSWAQHAGAWPAAHILSLLGSPDAHPPWLAERPSGAGTSEPCVLFPPCGEAPHWQELGTG